jgi:predicted NBD/HSP70 family sugar kinase
MYYGFDIGGSKIALGVFDDTRRLQWEKRVATPKDSYETFLTTIAQLVAEADARFGGRAVSALVFRVCRKPPMAPSMPPMCLPPVVVRCAKI